MKTKLFIFILMLIAILGASTTMIAWNVSKGLRYSREPVTFPETEKTEHFVKDKEYLDLEDKYKVCLNSYQEQPEVIPPLVNLLEQDEFKKLQTDLANLTWSFHQLEISCTEQVSEINRLNEVVRVKDAAMLACMRR